MTDTRFDQRYQLILIPGKTPCHKSCTEFQRQSSEINRTKHGRIACLSNGSRIRSSGILSFSQAVATIVHHDIDHVEVSPDDMGKLPHTNRSRITIS